MLGISPGIVSDPLAGMSTPAVKDLVLKVGGFARKPQDLAIASMAVDNPADRAFLTAASIVKLDNGFRIEKHWVAENSNSRRLCRDAAP
jgi:hypothetical protein